MSDNSTLDLDALAPKKSSITLDGKSIAIHPPRTGQMIRVGAMGERLKKMNDIKPEEADELDRDMTALIKELVPELPEDLALVQKVAVLNHIASMSMPKDAKELAKKGVTVDSPKASHSE